MNTYFERFGGIRDYLTTVVDEARKNGYTETIMGRRRYLPDLTSDNRIAREAAQRMALNAPIQGSAADVIKKAMLSVQAALEKGGFTSRLLLQVHDELILEIVSSEEAAITELVRKEMTGAYLLRTPLNVGIGIGKNWNEANH
jgi:DNA polymerase-1